jgi:Na+-translocating ferredoxin:NAD+ oxidoreductase RnfD subunit
VLKSVLAMRRHEGMSDGQPAPKNMRYRIRVIYLDLKLFLYSVFLNLFQHGHFLFLGTLRTNFFTITSMVTAKHTSRGGVELFCRIVLVGYSIFYNTC